MYALILTMCLATGAFDCREDAVRTYPTVQDCEDQAKKLSAMDAPNLMDDQGYQLEGVICRRVEEK